MAVEKNKEHANLSLPSLLLNEIAYVDTIQCSPLLKNRLLDMGLTLGTKIRVTRIAPLGDPIEIELRGYRIALRKGDAQHIYVSRGDKNE